MRRRILTERERQELETYLTTRKNTPLISTLRWRSKQYLIGLKEEIEILERFLEQ